MEILQWYIVSVRFSPKMDKICQIECLCFWRKITIFAKRPILTAKACVSQFYNRHFSQLKTWGMHTESSLWRLYHIVLKHLPILSVCFSKQWNKKRKDVDMLTYYYNFLFLFWCMLHKTLHLTEKINSNSYYGFKIMQVCEVRPERQRYMVQWLKMVVLKTVLMQNACPLL